MAVTDIARKKDNARNKAAVNALARAPHWFVVQKFSRMIACDARYMSVSTMLFN
jgi:hypothetical protein